MKILRLLFLFSIIPLALTACSTSTFFEPQDGPPKINIDVSKIPNAVPKIEPKYRYGNTPDYCVYGTCYHVLKSSKGYVETGIASWYGTKFDHQLTSSREPYDMLKMTAASNVLPLPTYVRVTNLKNGKQVIVKVNDRGPFAKNRVIDLSYAAASKLDMLPEGTALVRVEAIDPTQQHFADAARGVKPMKNAAIYLQIGAYTNHANALLMQKRATEAVSMPCKIFVGKYQGKTIYRVKIGPIHDVATVDKVTRELETAQLSTIKTSVQVEK